MTRSLFHFLLFFPHFLLSFFSLLRTHSLLHFLLTFFHPVQACIDTVSSTLPSFLLRPVDNTKPPSLLLLLLLLLLLMLLLLLFFRLVTCIKGGEA